MVNCYDCKYYDSSVDACNADELCPMQEHDEGRKEREKEIIALIYYFEKTWNKESHKRVPHKAIEELTEFIRQNDIPRRVNTFIKSNLCNCTNCILDGTDACVRGAGRAVNDEICIKYLSEGDI